MGLVLILTAGMSACATPAPTPTPIDNPSLVPTEAPTTDPSPSGGWVTADPSASPDPNSATSAAFGDLVWPFTGMKAEEGADLTRPSVAVKVDNAKAARPQTGLEAADVVVEEVVEGGTTRFLAIYHSQFPEAVAPVRSGRPVDTEILPPFGTDLAMSGAADPTLVTLRNGGLNLWLHGEVKGAFHRVKGRKAPHNLSVNLAKVAEHVQATGRTVPPSPFLFNDSPPEAAPEAGVTSITKADLTISPQTKVTWTWSGKDWKRTQDGDQPWTAATVVVIQAKVFKDGGVDSGGNATVHTNLLGSGEATVLRDGMAIVGRWSKSSPRDPLSLVDQQGVPIFLAPGQVWIELAPNTPTLQSSG